MNILAALLAGLVGQAEMTHQCDLDPAHVGAKYEITSQTTQPKKSSERVMYLWRNDKEVAHQYPQEQVTEIWNLVSDGRIRPIRYFESERRGIEYQPEDINKGKGDRNWPGKFQLISDQQKNKMTLVSSDGAGCDRIETYEFKDGKAQIRLSWLPALKLVQSYSVQQKHLSLQWQLTDVFDNQNRIQALFQSYRDYQLTDYADIGDNESDPFLQKLINLGFVSHGASGFYDDQGNVLESAHHH
ncbi:hypothetical protein BTA51_00920 [Hahella sp. CCB-MM4]|uniref:hypothetical protein n=1 Tax=Hahella sp. (strain CCB-MM4) TaxID=1926491 RepID=UPI000B9A9F2F|nr:hypothetical protein [Hahella sp. CCB-MM4]OZG74996.1 hypothetical protein BTA51_00920 [Hahella sp. CCB-MM4]